MNPNDMKPSAPRKRKAWLLLLIPLGFAVIPAIRYLSEDPAGELVPPTSVVVSDAVRAEVRESLTYSGILEPKSTVGVVPKIAGQVAEIHVAAGDTVAAGDVLVSLDDERVDLQAQTARSAWDAARARYDLAVRGPRDQELANARASLDQAERDLVRAERSVERTERLFDAGTVSRTELEAAQSQVEAARTGVDNTRRLVRLMEEGAGVEELEAARANVEAARQQYELAAIRRSDADVAAPVAGTIARVLVEEGDTVGAGLPVASIINASILTAKVAVPERHYGRVRRAASDLIVDVRPIAYEEGLSFDGRLVQIEQTVDPRSRTFTVEIAVDNSEGLLLPGMYATVELIVAVEEDAVVVPRSAVLNRDGGSVVFLSDGGGRARMVRVETGATTNGAIHIRSGVAAGDAVIIEGNAFLEEDQVVQVAVR